jgi:hypothetical protein
MSRLPLPPNLRRILASLSFVLSAGCGPDDTPQTPWLPGQGTSPTSVEYHGRLTWTFVPDGQSQVSGVNDEVVQMMSYPSGNKLMQFPEAERFGDDFWVAATWHVTAQTGESLVLGYPLPHNFPDNDCRVGFKGGAGSGTVSSTHAELHLSGVASGCNGTGSFDATFTGDLATP